MADPLASPSQRQYALDWLRNQIVAGELQPGARLVETDLAGRLGTSRAPVREALRQLEQEGLVVSRPYAATEVMGVTQDEVEQVLVPIRLTIERFAFSTALAQLTDADFDRLAELVDAMQRTGESGDLDALAEADVRFHELVIERSGQPHCLQVWRTIEPRVRAYFRRDAPAHQRPEEVADEHRELLEVLRGGDRETTVATLEAHIHNYFDTAARPRRPARKA
jgi:DNA-binding GntR family transcriptional regulator